MDTYGAGFAVLWTAFWEVVGLMWIYGYRNVCKDISLMIGSEPSIFWKITWVLVCPIVLLVLFILGLVIRDEHKYGGVIPYPDWATGIGWGLVAISAFQVGRLSRTRLTQPLLFQLRFSSDSHLGHHHVHLLLGQRPLQPSGQAHP